MCALVSNTNKNIDVCAPPRRFIVKANSQISRLSPPSLSPRSTYTQLLLFAENIVWLRADCLDGEDPIYHQSKAKPQ